MNDPLIKPGDQLQSAASRMAAWILDPYTELGEGVPYEVEMAALEAQSAVDEWTEVRRNEATSKATGAPSASNHGAEGC